jgi:selenide, water dikinase
VQTVDFFTPIVDDPYAYGQIAAANALSDVYAMGGRPVTAMNLLGIPTEKVPPEAIAQILLGGAAKVKEAHCALVGGHTIKCPEPIYGLSVTGFVHPDTILANTNAAPGDLLLLTKPLGTGIITTGIKRGIVSRELALRAIDVMQQLNTAGAELAEQGLIRCATDVTGYGLLGHLANICRASRVTAEVSAARVPLIAPEVLELIDRDCIPGGTRSNLESVEPIVEWCGTTPTHRLLLTDAQTSGGLLLCVPPANLETVRKVLAQHGAPVDAVVGMIRDTGEARIVVI